MDKKRFKSIYKRFYEDSWFTLKCALSIILILLGIYFIFAVLLNYLGSFSNLDFLSYVIGLILLSIIASFIEPFIYSYYALSGALHGPRSDEIRLSSFFKTTRIGRQPPFKGQLRIWNNLLFSIIIFLILSSVANGIVMLISMTPGSELNVIYQEISELNFNDTVSLLNGMSQIVAAHEPYIRFVTLFSNFPALFIAFYYFLHKVAVGTFKYYIAPTIRNAPPQVSNSVLRSTIRSDKSYYKGYYETLFPLTILYVVAFSASYFLFGLLGSSFLSIDFISLTSIFITLLALIPFLPLVFDYHDYIRPTFMKKVMSNFFSQAERELQMYKSRMEQMKMNDANQVDLFEKNLENMKKAILDQEEIDKDETNKKEDQDKKD